jgi:SWI/SNF-related matrix-associated actin-dependent regulator 1 of chromatin subfamily A
MMTITETGKGFEISFPFDYAKIKEVKAIDGAWFYGSRKTWVVPKVKRREVEALMKKYGVRDIAEANIPEIVEPAAELPDLKIELNIPRTPFPFQKKGIAYMMEKRRCINGDQPGLGKTTQAIAAAVALQAKCILVICPSSLKLNWQKEWLEVAGRKSLIMSDSMRNTWHTYYNVGMANIFICNYESLKKYFVQPGWTKPKDGTFRMNTIPFRPTINLFDTVIVDESHRCKDGTTQQTKLVMGICRSKENVFLLTGTPIVNKPKDLVAQLHINNMLKDVVAHLPQPIDAHGRPTDGSGYKRFMNRYCEGGSGASNLKELNSRLTKTCFFRREKADVLKDLPPKIRQVILCDITNRTEYNKAERDFVDYLKSVKGCTDSEIKKKLRGEVMVKIGVLKQISARGKMNEVKDHIDEVISSGEKIIVFCSLREIGDKIKEMYPGAVMVRGGMSDEEKNAAVVAFQNDPKVKVIICSIKAAGVGLTLTASSRELFVEFPWTFADCEQCEDRAHRIGQLDSVQSGYLLGENTIDRWCYDLIQKKKSIAQIVTGAVDEVQEEIIDELLNLFNQ